VLDNGEVTIRAVIVPHLSTSYAYRIDSAAGAVVFSGDTGPSEAVSDLARGADVLVHEVMDIDAMIAASSARSPGTAVTLRWSRSDAS